MNHCLLLPTAELLPQDGDVVLAPEAEAGVAWILSRYRGPAEISTQSREDAVGIACAVARELAIDVWSLENGHYWRVETHRNAARVISS